MLDAFCPPKTVVMDQDGEIDIKRYAKIEKIFGGTFE